MAKITKLEAAGRQLDSAIRMFFANEDILAVHTVARAAFRILYDITKEAKRMSRSMHTSKRSARRDLTKRQIS
jgi:hypothetical protein